MLVCFGIVCAGVCGGVLLRAVPSRILKVFGNGVLAVDPHPGRARPAGYEQESQASQARPAGSSLDVFMNGLVMDILAGQCWP